MDLELQSSPPEEGPRVGRVGFALVALPVLLGVWIGALTELMGQSEHAVLVALGAFVVGGLVRAPVVRRRLTDVGRPPWFLFWAMVPVADVVVTFMLLGDRTPSPELRRRRRAQWQHQIGPFAALGQGLGLVVRTAWWALPVTLVGSVVVGGGEELVRGPLMDAARADAAVPRELAWLMLGATTGWGLLQYSKAQRVSRASWWPVLLVLPSAALVALLSLAPTSGQGSELALLMVASLAWLLGVGSIVGGVVATFWIVCGVRAIEGRSLSVGEVLRDVRRSLADVVVAWGARNQIVQVGMQVVVPGVWYAVSYAFTDIVAAVRPERPMFSGSTELARGIRSKIFTVIGVGALLQTALALAETLRVLDVARAFGSLLDPRVIPADAAVRIEVVGWLVGWWTTMALLVIFRERDQRLVERRARAAPASAPVAGAPVP